MLWNRYGCHAAPRQNGCNSKVTVAVTHDAQLDEYERSSELSVQTKVRACLIAAGGVAALVGGVAAGMSIRLARVAVRVESGNVRPVTVTRLVQSRSGEPPRVWIRGEGAFAQGVYSLLFDSPGAKPQGEPNGHARLGPVLKRKGQAALRDIVKVDRGKLETGASGRMTGWWYTAADELGYRVEHVKYDSERGPIDAWIVHPRWKRKKRYAIHTHGRGANPAETFRGLAPFAQAGVTSIVIAYRNDDGQPKGHGGRYGLGISESRDIDAAIELAIERGAERVTLVGWSMGGTASLYAANRGRFRNYIDGIVLDSPGSDWRAIIRSHAAARKVPRCIAEIGMALIRRGIVRSGEPGGIDFEAISPQTFAKELTVPVLLLASENDRFVPWHGSQQIASLRPDLVQLKSVPDAGHVRLWNVDPEGWEQSVLTFVRALPKPAWRGQ